MANQGMAMEREGFLRRHNVLIKCTVVSFATHLLFLLAFHVAAIRQEPLPSHLWFSLLSVPDVWEKTTPFAEATSDLARAETSLLDLIEAGGPSSHPKLELLHKQLIWEEEPKSMAASPFFFGVQDWIFRKEEADYSVLLGFLGDDPLFLASDLPEGLIDAKVSRNLSSDSRAKIEFSAGLRTRGLIDVEPPEVPEAVAGSAPGGSVRLSIAVDSSGVVRHALVLRSSSDPRMDAAALQIIKRWRFSATPEKDDQPPLWGWVELPFLEARGKPEGGVVMETASDKKKAN
jgi:TonB family protein